MSYWGLENEDIVAPGWSLREGWACGPSAEGGSPGFEGTWITAPTYEEVVWRTWCALAGNYHLQDGKDVVWPGMPDDWRRRVREAELKWGSFRTDAVWSLQEPPYSPGPRP